MTTLTFRVRLAPGASTTDARHLQHEVVYRLLDKKRKGVVADFVVTQSSKCAPGRLAEFSLIAVDTSQPTTPARPATPAGGGRTMDRPKSAPSPALDKIPTSIAA